MGIIFLYEVDFDGNLEIIVLLNGFLDLMRINEGKLVLKCMFIELSGGFWGFSVTKNVWTIRNQKQKLLPNHKQI